MAELSWDNGKLLVNEFGLGDSSGTAAGTLESIVNLATQPPPPPPPQPRPPYHDDIDVPLMNIQHQPSSSAVSSVATSFIDALVPCGGIQRLATCDVNGSARGNKGKRMSAIDTCENDSCGSGAATASFGSLATTRDTISLDESRDSEACLARSQGNTFEDEEKKNGTATRSSVLTKRSRAAANHNQSERKRRQVLNEKMEILQKLVPKSSKTDKSSMLDGVIDYIKILQTQVQLLMMNKTNTTPSISMTSTTPSTMMSYAMPQQHFQMPMMSPMGIVANMNMNMAHQNLASLTRPPLVNPSASFMPMVAMTNQLPSSLAHASSSDLSSFPAQSQLQSMSVEEFTRALALLQLHQKQELEASKK